MHVAGVLAVHTILLIHEVVSGALQLHQLPVGLKQLRLLNQLLGLRHNLRDCAKRRVWTAVTPDDNVSKRIMNET